MVQGLQLIKKESICTYISMPSIVLCSLWVGSCAIDFTQLGQKKCFGTKRKTEISNSLSVFV